MRITAIDRREGRAWFITFERDGEEVTKFARLGDCARAIYKSEEARDSQFYWEVSKAAREADRDIAYRLHGKDFRDHCEFKTDFFSLLPPEEMRKLIDPIPSEWPPVMRLSIQPVAEMPFIFGTSA